MDKGASTLKKLCELDFDAIEAYEEAMKRLENKGLADKLAEYRSDHMAHTDTLNKFLESRGEEVVEGPDGKRVLTEGKVVMADLLGDKAILKAMTANEKVTVNAYKEASENDALNAEEKTKVLEYYEDEKRHHDWIKTKSEEL